MLVLHYLYHYIPMLSLYVFLINFLLFLLCSHPGPVNQSITFNPSQRFGSISFGLMDDSIALEDPERFQLRFSQHSFPDGSKVRLGPNSDVSILDDDGNFYYYKIIHNFLHCVIVVSVTFAQPSYSYFESNGTVSNIMLRLNTSIARPLSVLVSGGKHHHIVSIMKIYSTHSPVKLSFNGTIICIKPNIYCCIHSVLLIVCS